MKTTGNTVLVTGGGSGIGFEIAKLLSSKGNQVIITGRNADRLQSATAGLTNVTAIAADITKEADVQLLAQRLQAEFPDLNIVINNAGNASVFDTSAAGVNGFDKAAEEILVNYLSVIRLNEKLLPVLKQQETAAIVNVSSIAALVPNRSIPTYAASKAALHSYSQTLRINLENSGSHVKVFELMPPLVNTDFSKEIGGHNGMPPLEVAEDLLDAFENDEYEIHTGKTADIFKLFLSSPADALAAMNGVSE